MKFPGKRKKKHYFPVGERGRIPFETFATPGCTNRVYIVGIDQLLVDIEAHVEDAYLEEYGLEKGQSFILDDNDAEAIYQELKEAGKIKGEFAGGTVGNTLHNYSVLADDKAVALGCITKKMTIGDYAFKYISNTNSHVDFSSLQPVNGPMGRAICFVTPDGERSFGISKGCMNDLDESFISESLIKNSALLLISAYLLRDKDAKIYKSTMKAVKIAKEADVPVVFSMGTSFLIEEDKEFYQKFIEENVTVVAMNDMEAQAFTGEPDFLKAIERTLDFCDLTLVTVGEEGLYIGSYVDEMSARMTNEPLISKSISEYNKFEYSRGMKKSHCFKPIKIYSHINPFLGGPNKIKNTNGAGDAALAALLHDISANQYHRRKVPNSPKHENDFITYSSISQICKYSNRVSYEVLARNSPRLTRGLPEKEDSLEEAYWASF